MEHAAGDRCGDGRAVAVARRQSSPTMGVAASAVASGPKPPRPPVASGGSARGRVPPKSSEERRRPAVEAASAARRSPSLPLDTNAAEASEAARRGPRGSSGARSVSVPRKRLASPAPEVDRKDVGKVPAYLKRRQEEVAEQKRLDALPTQPKPPPGYRRVDEEEKEESLSVLRGRRKEAVKQQEQLPFCIETPGQKKREQELKDRIAHLDKLIGMFSKPTVFFPADADSIAKTFPVQQDSPSVRRSPSPGGGGACAAMYGGPAPVSHRSNSPRSGASLASIGGIGGRQKQPLHTGVQIVAPPGGKSSLSLGWD